MERCIKQIVCVLEALHQAAAAAAAAGRRLLPDVVTSTKRVQHAPANQVCAAGNQHQPQQQQKQRDRAITDVSLGQSWVCAWVCGHAFDNTGTGIPQCRQALRRCAIAAGSMDACNMLQRDE